MIVPIDSKFIHQKSEKFNFQSPPFDSIEFAHTLAEAMLENNGIGLAAPQIEIPYQIIAIRANPIIVMYNPRIIDTSTEEIVLEEGCCSYPGIYANIGRPRRIKVRYTEPNGNTITKTFEDLSARVIQHEIDHLNGVTMIEKMDRFHKEKALRKLKQLKRRS